MAQSFEKPRPGASIIRAFRAARERVELHGHGAEKEATPLVIENQGDGGLITVSIGDGKVKIDPAKLLKAAALFAPENTVKIRIS